MALTKQEQLQIQAIVDRVVEARLLEFSHIQLSLIQEMLLTMTDRYVESLMRLCRALGLPDEAARKEAKRMAEMMLQGLQK